MKKSLPHLITIGIFLVALVVLAVPGRVAAMEGFSSNVHWSHRFFPRRHSVEPGRVFHFPHRLSHSAHQIDQHPVISHDPLFGRHFQQGHGSHHGGFNRGGMVLFFRR